MALMETFEHKGKTWRRYTAEPLRDQFIVGVDLGQSSDPTAVCILDHHREVRDTWTTAPLPGGGGIIRQDADEHSDARHLARLPLGMPYPMRAPRAGILVCRPRPARGEVR